MAKNDKNPLDAAGKKIEDTWEDLTGNEGKKGGQRSASHKKRERKSSKSR